MCSEPPSASSSSGIGAEYDLLIFPDMVRYNRVTEEDLARIVQDHVARGELCSGLSTEKLSGSYVFVCTHGTRDARCGVCGTRVLNAFNEVMNSSPELAQLRGKIVVRATSCIGSHKYAANVIIYNSKGSNKCFGDLYGYVQPSDAERLVTGHIMKEQIQKDIWRGRMGLSKEMQVKLLKFVSTSSSAPDNLSLDE